MFCRNNTRYFFKITILTLRNDFKTIKKYFGSLNLFSELIIVMIYISNIVLFCFKLNRDLRHNVDLQLQDVFSAFKYKDGFLLKQ